MSYRRRLSLSIVALIMALVTVLSLAYLRYLLGVQFRFALDQAEIVAEQVRSTTLETISRRMDERGFVPELVTEDPQFSAILQRVLGSSEIIAEIVLTDERGRVLASSATGLASSDSEQQWTGRPPLDALARQDFLSQLRALYTPLQEYEVSRGLTADGRPILSVRVVVSTALLLKQLDPQIRGLVRWAVVSILASLALAVLFSRLAFRPLGRLGEAIDRMTHGEFSLLPQPAARRDEYSAITSKLSLLGQQFRDAREGMSSLRGNIEQLMRRLNDAVLLFDQDDKLIIASAAAEGFLGPGRWQLMGQKIEDIFPPGTDLGALVLSAVRLRQSIVDQVVELPVTEGSNGARPSRVLLSVEVMDDFATRRRQGALVTLRDADTRRQIETTVEVSTRLAAISRLTGGVAHEIKNPLNAISLHLDLLKNRLAKSQIERPKELEVIAREVTRLDRVVKTFLDFNRPVELQLSEVHPGGLLEEVAALAEPEAHQQRVEIKVSNACPDTVIRADRDLVKQALLNLAVNGIQAMPQGGELKLGAERAGSDVELTVSDQGVGIDAKHRDDIFRLYYTTKKNGSGIGLAMTFRVVALHNGTIEFSSEPGQGTTFRIRFPVLENR